MSRIMKVRTIPRGYVGIEDLKGFVHENNGRTPAEWFMALYKRFGNPQDGGMWSYMLKHNNVVMKVTAQDAENMEYDVWVSPGCMLNAKRKRTKAMNVIARRLNTEGVVFLAEDGDSLYYPIKKKNSELLAKKPMTDKAIRNAMTEAMTDEESNVIHGSLTQFMNGAKEEIVNTIGEIFNEGND